MEDIGNEKVLASNKISSGQKKEKKKNKKNYECFIGYLCNVHKVKPLHIRLPKISAYVKSYDGQTKWMYFHDLLRKI